MADMEFGKCDICGKEAALSRTYFKYRIGSCECCGCKLVMAQMDILRLCVIAINVFLIYLLLYILYLRL